MPLDTDGYDLDRDKQAINEWVLTLPPDKLMALSSELPERLTDVPHVGWLWEAVRARLKCST